MEKDLNLETTELKIGAIIVENAFQPHYTNALDCRVHRAGNVGTVVFNVKYSTDLQDRDIDVTIDILDIMKVIDAYLADDCEECKL